MEHYKYVGPTEFKFTDYKTRLCSKTQMFGSIESARTPFNHAFETLGHRVIGIACEYYANVLYTADMAASPEVEEEAGKWFEGRITKRYPNSTRNEGEEVSEYLKRCMTDSQNHFWDDIIMPDDGFDVSEISEPAYQYILQIFSQTQYWRTVRKANGSASHSQDYNKAQNSFHSFMISNTYDQVRSWKSSHDIEEDFDSYDPYAEEEVDYEKESAKVDLSTLSFLARIPQQLEDWAEEINRSRDVVRFTYHLTSQDLWQCIADTYSMEKNGEYARGLWHHLLVWQLIYGLPDSYSQSLHLWINPIATESCSTTQQLTDFYRAMNQYIPQNRQIDFVVSRVTQIKDLIKSLTGVEEGTVFEPEGQN